MTSAKPFICFCLLRRLSLAKNKKCNREFQTRWTACTCKTSCCFITLDRKKRNIFIKNIVDNHIQNIFPTHSFCIFVNYVNLNISKTRVNTPNLKIKSHAALFSWIIVCRFPSGFTSWARYFESDFTRYPSNKSDYRKRVCTSRLTASGKREFDKWNGYGDIKYTQ